MNDPKPNISVAVDLTNPGQFFACCGLFELASRSAGPAEAWFGKGMFHVASEAGFSELLRQLREAAVDNTMLDSDRIRLEELSAMTKRQREAIPGAEDEKKRLESLRRELPIEFGGIPSPRIDWFADDFAGGSRFKTWAGQQSVLEIARAMHGGLSDARIADGASIWNGARRIGLPFYFDSDLGGQGSALDIGFSFDPLSGSEATRIEGICRPGLELLAFIGLQRFRPREIAGKNRFVYVAWPVPLPVSVAAAAACQGFALRDAPTYEFRLLYRTKYLKSFLPAIPFQGDRDE